MIETIFFALWFFLPAGLANAAPVFANKIPLLNQFKTPIDFGLSHKGKRILGDNKTWRGLLFGVSIAVLTLAIQKVVYKDSIWLQDTLPSTIDYVNVSLWLGVLLGFGALLGDAVESFFKRRSNVRSGEAWFPFDQLDYILGGLLLSSVMVSLSPAQNATIVLVWFGLHLLSSYIGFLMGLKDKPI